MKALYGVCNHDIGYIHNALKDTFETRILLPSQILRAPVSPAISVLLIPTLDCLRRNRKLLSASKVIAILFDCVPNCMRVQNIILLDVKKISRGITSSYTRLSPERLCKTLYYTPSTSVEVVISNADPTLSLLKTIKSSTLHMILAHLYKVPSGRRKKEQQRLFRCLQRNDVETALSMVLNIDSDASRRLARNIKSGKASNLFNAVSQLSNSNISEVAERFSVSEFDLRYVFKTLNK